MQSYFDKGRGVLLTFLYMICFHSAFALAPGDIIFTGFNADGNDGFSFLALTDIPAFTQINFTNSEWNEMAPGSGGAFAGGVAMVWENMALTPEGTTITFTNLGVGDVNIGAVLNVGDISVDDTNEVIYAYQGAGAGIVFLSAIANNGFVNGPLTNTGLTAGVDAIELNDDDDVIVYTGGGSCGSSAACRTDIANSANWTGEGASGNQDQDAAFPDFPDDIETFSNLLPIELLSFDAQLTETSEVLLTWQTSSETNNDFFSLERSRDGVQWHLVAKIEGAGDSETRRSYRSTDRYPLVGDSYYRLKQTDFDGLFSYSWIRQVAIAQLDDWHLYPNPTVNWITVEGLLDSDFRIYDIQGRDVSHLTKGTSSEGHPRVDVKGLSTGVYILRSPSGSRRFLKH